MMIDVNTEFSDKKIIEIAKEMKTWWSNEGSDVDVQVALDKIISIAKENQDYDKCREFFGCLEEGSFKNFSDGNHTFDELYRHRMILTALVFNAHPDIAWKSKKHYDPENNPMFDDMFIVGIETPEGQATYHYHLEYWDLFKVKELETAPEWDDHTSEMALDRLKSLLNTQTIIIPKGNNNYEHSCK